MINMALTVAFTVTPANLLLTRKMEQFARRRFWRANCQLVDVISRRRHIHIVMASPSLAETTIYETERRGKFPGSLQPDTGPRRAGLG